MKKRHHSSMRHSDNSRHHSGHMMHEPSGKMMNAKYAPTRGQDNAGPRERESLGFAHGSHGTTQASIPNGAARHNLREVDSYGPFHLAYDRFSAVEVQQKHDEEGMKRVMRPSH